MIAAYIAGVLTLPLILAVVAAYWYFKMPARVGK